MSEPRLDPPELRIAAGYVSGIDVVTVTGTLDLFTAHELRNVVFDPTRRVQPVMLLDLDGLEMLDSQGIATIVATRRHVAGRSGELVLACTQPRLRRLLRINRLDTVLRIVAGLDELQFRDETA